MARARQLKPGFFKNEDLARCTPWARLMFEGLWTLSDREGRLEDRPTYIKGEIFPHDNVDPEVLLTELAELKDHFNRAAFILRYEVGECKYIQIINFGKHQNPHVKEPASTLPAPCKPGANTGRAPGRHRASRASSLFPLPSSLTPSSLTPDSPLPGSGASTGHAPAKKFTPPTAEEVQAYLDELGERRFSGEAFVDAYQVTGWKTKGGEPIKDWPAAVRNWRHMRDQRGEIQATPKGKSEVLCRDCHEPMTKPETMESTTCRTCRQEHGV